jgi:hypothetical protein
MDNQDAGTTEKPLKRFATYEEFLKAFYPKAEANKPVEKEEESGDFGMSLAIDSLRRHAAVLKFGNVPS